MIENGPGETKPTITKTANTPWRRFCDRTTNTTTLINTGIAATQALVSVSSAMTERGGGNTPGIAAGLAVAYTLMEAWRQYEGIPIREERKIRLRKIREEQRAKIAKIELYEAQIDLYKFAEDTDPGSLKIRALYDWAEYYQTKRKEEDIKAELKGKPKPYRETRVSLTHELAVAASAGRVYMAGINRNSAFDPEEYGRVSGEWKTRIDSYRERFKAVQWDEGGLDAVMTADRRSAGLVADMLGDIKDNLLPGSAATLPKKQAEMNSEKV